MDIHRLLIASCVVAPLSWGFDPISASERSPSFYPLREPLLRLVLQRRAADNCHRLVSIRGGDATPLVLLEGTLEECEQLFLDQLQKRLPNPNVNVPTVTLGGKQFWGDLFVHAGWRIQENVFTSHCRLLDPRDIRRAWGTREQCHVAFEEIRIKRKIQPRSDHLVILLHGLLRSKDSMNKIAESLVAAGYDVANINYPSTQRSITEHAERLKEIVESLWEYEKLSFVTSSLGGIVVRKFLTLESHWRDRIQLHRIVMLAPPSRGSVVAKTLKNNILFRIITGKSGAELTPQLVEEIPSPDCSFGIIAGGTGKKSGFAPFLDGDNDGLVLVENTKLTGADDFLRIRAVHTFIMQNDNAINATISFLERGRFSEE